MLLSPSGVDSLVTLMEGGDARHAFLRGGVHGFEKNFKPKLLVLLYRLR